MNPEPLTIEVTGLDESLAMTEALRDALTDRSVLHAEMAGNMLEFSRQYLLSTPRHNTAEKLGARPTNFRAANARVLQAASDADAAILRIPRNTGLGRSFGPITIRPLGGRKFISIPNMAETYGRQPSEFPDDTFDFAVIFTHRGPTPVLMWAESGGDHKKGEIAFWLRREVTQKQDRTLLPSDESYQELGRRTVIAYYQHLIDGGSESSGPRGGTSTGMPSA